MGKFLFIVAIIIGLVLVIGGPQDSGPESFVRFLFAILIWVGGFYAYQNMGDSSSEKRKGVRK